MRNKDQRNTQVDHISEKTNATHGAIAMSLLEEYEDRLKAGENPDPTDYLKRYTGLDEHEFRIELNLATILTTDGVVSQQETQEILQDQETERAKQALARKLL